ncbi:MAG: DUF998 domain-containing protein [Clostridiales bacterium]|nr:DUF998 domain-containing protein [Clostridiales bacterium]
MTKKRTALIALLGTILFTLSFTVHGLLRAGYDPWRNYVSELSLGSTGWIQIVSFLLMGLCLGVFAYGVSKAFPSGRVSRAGPALLLTIAACYFVSGIFVTDPAAMFNQQTVHGILHGIFGALVFALSPVCCFVFWLRFRTDPRWKPLKTWTLAAAVLQVIVVVLMKIAQPLDSALHSYAGLIQRCALLTFYAWLVAFAYRLYSCAKDAERV